MAEAAPLGSEGTELKPVSQEAAQYHFSWEAFPSDSTRRPCPVTPVPGHGAPLSRGTTLPSRQPLPHPGLAMSLGGQGL